MVRPESKYPSALLLSPDPDLADGWMEHFAANERALDVAKNEKELRGVLEKTVPSIVLVDERLPVAVRARCVELIREKASRSVISYVGGAAAPGGAGRRPKRGQQVASRRLGPARGTAEKSDGNAASQAKASEEEPSAKLAETPVDGRRTATSASKPATTSHAATIDHESAAREEADENSSDDTDRREDVVTTRAATASRDAAATGDGDARAARDAPTAPGHMHETKISSRAAEGIAGEETDSPAEAALLARILSSQDPEIVDGEGWGADGADGADDHSFEDEPDIWDALAAADLEQAKLVDASPIPAQPPPRSERSTSPVVSAGAPGVGYERSDSGEPGKDPGEQISEQPSISARGATASSSPVSVEFTGTANEFAQPGRRRLPTLLRVSHLAAFAATGDGEMIEWNSALRQLVGGDPDIWSEDLALTDLFVRDGEAKELLERIRVSGSIDQFETVFSTSSDDVVPVFISITSGHDPTGELVLQGIVWRRDRSDTPPSGSAISNEFFRHIVEDSEELIWVVTNDGTISYANPRVCEVLGDAEAAEPDRSLLASTHPDDVELLALELASVTADDDAPSVTIRFRGQDEQWRRVSLTMTRFARETAAPILISGRTAAEADEREIDVDERAARHRMLVDRAPVPIIVVAEGRLAYVNDAMIELLDYESSADLIGHPLDEIIHPSFGARAREWLTEVYRDETTAPPTRGIFRRIDGTPVEIELTGITLDVAGRRCAQVIGRPATVAMPVSSHVPVLAHALEVTPDTVILVSEDGTVAWANAAFCETHEYPLDEIVGEDVRAIGFGHEGGGLYAEIWDSLRADQAWSGEITLRRRSGELFHTEATVTPVRVGEPMRLYYVIVHRDISQRKAAEERLAYLAYHDALTGLPNRRRLEERLEAFMQLARRQGLAVSLIFIDLDKFKHVNDTLGHDAGDELLQLVATRLAQVVRQPDVLCRLGGDEFAIVGLLDRDDAAHLSRRVLKEIQTPFIVRDESCSIGASLGIATFPHDATAPAELTRYADLAMYRSKSRGGGYAFHDPVYDEAARAKMSLEAELRAALRAGHLSLMMQPLLNLRTNAVTGAEALVRWKRESGDLLEPEAFLPIAEDTGLILEIDRFVVEEAIATAARWSRPGRRMDIAINVSARSIRDADFRAALRDSITRQHFRADRVILEINESAIIEDPSRTIESLRELKRLGVRLAVDDFGSGNASLQYIKALPVDLLKIDPQYIRNVNKSDQEEQLLVAFLSIARALGLETVAEGVEEEEQLEWLRAVGCDVVQGNLIGPPDIPANFVRHLDRD